MSAEEESEAAAAYRLFREKQMELIAGEVYKKKLTELFDLFKSEIIEPIKEITKEYQLTKEHISNLIQKIEKLEIQELRVTIEKQNARLEQVIDVLKKMLKKMDSSQPEMYR